jgi:hypothetical protein
MLNLLPGTTRDCEGVSRRSFLQVGSLGALGVSLPSLLQAKQAAAKAKSNGTDVNCILIWTRGGTSHHDTFDPKPQAPVSVRGEYGAIDTAVPGVQFSEIMPTFAKEAGRFGLLRGWNPKNGSHGTADQYVMSGNKFNPSLHYPTYGSVISYHKGFKSAMPPFVQLGSQVDHRFGGGLAGVLGLQHNPFEMLADPNAAKFNVRDITPPQGITMNRVDRRKKMLSVIDNLQNATDIQPRAYDALDEHYKAALNMITAPETKKAFEIEKEDPKLRDRYGRERFGQSCLLARRLIESGVRFVTVTDGSWDTHQKNFVSLKTRLIPRLDKALPQLLTDLEERGLLDTTLVVWLTDFGRTPKINSASGRDHWSSAGFALMAGAGVPGGSVVGATDDEGGRPVRNEYYSEDIAATVLNKLGIPLNLIARALDGRPVTINHGRVIKEWS